jgi:type VI secretion system protein ImpL
MQRIWNFLLNPRTLVALGLLALVACLWLGADLLDLGLMWVMGVLLALLGLWLAVWGARRWRARTAGRKLVDAMDQDASQALQSASGETRAQLVTVRERMQQAIGTIKGSRLGGSASALYELPWYAVIGNPAAGKSSAIVSSGLNFPFLEASGGGLQGIGGTRNCDWFFTTEGILLDTAGRYSVQREDRGEWLGFLSLLKRYRAKAPLNGVIIAASLSELAGSRPEFAMELAKQLRQRVQELTEKLEVFAPVYVVFTKADLVAGFNEFFDDHTGVEREKIWGATLPYDIASPPDVPAVFDAHFDQLTEGLKEASMARLALHKGGSLPAGVLSFPLEFAALKAPVRTFLSTLFEDNPFQFRPIFRGFYFTSAVQQGESQAPATQRVVKRFGLVARNGEQAEAVDRGGFFLKDLFSKVIFADRRLVQQYSNPAKTRLRYAAFLAGTLLLGACLSGWTWSYLNNRQLLANVQADLDQVVRLQDQRIDLQSRMRSLEVLQDRLEQLRRYRTDRPWRVSLGLYQGEAIEGKLRAEYMAGLREVLLKPTVSALDAYLQQVNSKAAQLQPLGRAVEGRPRSKGPSLADPAPSVYVAASPTDVSDAYNALKAYLMLGERGRMENAHLGDQITRFWRTWLEANRGAMPRDQMLRSAGNILSFALSEVTAGDFPETQINLALLDATRENLRRVVKGMPARERVYAEIKARAATRYPPVTVARLLDDADKDVVSGSYAIPGTFTRQAWQGFIDDAIQEAANKETRADDWVLKTTLQDDLTLEGSPAQIRKTLVDMYKTEYVAEWQKFMQGVSVNAFVDFDTAVSRMNRLGDPVSSPVGRLIQALYEQTSWDNPGLVAQQAAKHQEGFLAWFKQTVLRIAPPSVDVGGVSASVALPMGPIGKEFANLSRLMSAADSDSPTLIRNYLQGLSKIRTRFNLIKNAGDAGPASRQLMVQTLDGSSELADALRLVDEQMLVNQSDAAKATLRPLLVRPLMQAFGVLVAPAEAEINRAWSMQVHQPFLTQLAAKYPFEKTSRLDATSAEIGKIFGPEGAIAKFNEQHLQSLVVRRGDNLSPRTWADMGVRLQPAFTVAFPVWIAPVSSGTRSGPSAPPSAGTTQFQLMPVPSPSLSEYTVSIDGQVLRYRNTQPAWSSFVWPNEQGAPGVHIVGTDLEGGTVEFLNEPGHYGLERMLASARQRRLSNGNFDLAWQDNAGHEVKLRLRLISNSAAGAVGAAPGAQPPSVSGALLGTGLPTAVVGDGSNTALLSGLARAEAAP